jgi:hypothetical protein
MTKGPWPMCITNCADCGIGTLTLGEYYMVHDDLWEQAWAGRRKSWHCLPGQEYLCIGCLEERLGRTLLWCDFTDVPINDPDNPAISERLRDRMTTDGGNFKGPDGLIAWMLEGMLERLSEGEKAAVREAWRRHGLTP